MCCDLYFKLARTEEISGNESAALLLYLSSFCNSLNSRRSDRFVGSVNKIRRLQTRLSLSDSQLLSLIHSYGPLSDAECRKLLLYSINGYPVGIKNIMDSHTKHSRNGGNLYGTIYRQ